MHSISRVAAGAIATMTLAACEPLPETAGDGGPDPAAASASATATATATAQGGVAMPAGLSGEERVIWNSLTPAARRQAADYIAAGGTLKQFVAI